MKGIFQLYLAQVRQFLRDRMALFFVILLPVGLGVFFGYLFSGPDDFSVKVGIANLDQGRKSEALIGSFEQDPFRLIFGTREQLIEKLQDGDLDCVLILPESLSGDLAAGSAVQIEVFFDSGNPTSSGIGLSLVKNQIQEMNIVLGEQPRKLALLPRSIETSQLRPVDFYMPGMLGVALLWLGVFGTAQPFAAQRELKIYRRFQVTPVSKRAVLLSEILWRLTLGLLQASAFLAVGYLVFDVGIVSWLPFLGTVLLGTLVFVSMGYAIAGIGKSQESTMGIAQLINFPMMLLSGSIISSDMLPNFLRAAVNIMPLTYLSDLLRQTMVGAPGRYTLSVNFGILGAWFIICFGLAVWLWRWE